MLSAFRVARSISQLFERVRCTFSGIREGYVQRVLREALLGKDHTAGDES